MDGYEVTTHGGALNCTKIPVRSLMERLKAACKPREHVHSNSILHWGYLVYLFIHVVETQKSGVECWTSYSYMTYIK